MSDELKWLNRGATSLTLMLMGFDHELDRRLVQLRTALRDRDFSLETYQDALNAVETVYDELESQTDKSIDTYRKTFEVLLANDGSHILEPLNQEQPLLIDLLNLAEPLARHINTMRQLDHTTDDILELNELRHRLTRRFKSLLDTLMLMGDSSGTLGNLTNQLEEDPDWATLDSLAQKTITLLNTRLQEEKKQFEGYLSELNAKLTRINQIVESDSATLAELKQINLSFNQSISDQMNEARDKIDQQNQMDLLKTDLLSSLDAIADRLKTYQKTYDKKLNDLQSSKAEMTGHMATLEQENLELLTELHKERQLSMQDPLTGLPNRQGFNKRLTEELSRAQRYNHYLSIAILDIDFFKRINDDFGHLVGDKVLRMIAKEMKRMCRESDFLARFGGEEFVLLLPQTSLNDGFLAVEKLREHVASRPFHYQNKPVELTISGGVAERRNDETLETWLDRADAALYQSKRTGRNRTHMASE